MESYGQAIQRLWAERKHLGSAPRFRLEFLLRWSAVRVAHRRDYAKRRRGPARNQKWKRFIKAMCWVCHRAKATSRHHIIQVQHGGGNDERNMVPICDGCHAEVHPWMDASAHPMVAEVQQWDRHD